MGFFFHFQNKWWVCIPSSSRDVCSGWCCPFCQHKGSFPIATAPTWAGVCVSWLNKWKALAYLISLAPGPWQWRLYVPGPLSAAGYLVTSPASPTKTKQTNKARQWVQPTHRTHSVHKITSTAFWPLKWWQLRIRLRSSLSSHLFQVHERACPHFVSEETLQVSHKLSVASRSLQAELGLMSSLHWLTIPVKTVADLFVFTACEVRCKHL